MIRSYFSKIALVEAGADVDQLARKLLVAVEEFARIVLALPLASRRASSVNGKWSPIQIAAHLGLAHRLSAEAVRVVAAGGSPLVLPKGNLSPAGTMIAPDITVPGDIQTAEEALSMLELGAKELVVQVESAHQAGTRNEVIFVNPFFGPLTAVECLQLALVHQLHHHRQLPA